MISLGFVETYLLGSAVINLLIIYIRFDGFGLVPFFLTLIRCWASSSISFSIRMALKF